MSYRLEWTVPAGRDMRRLDEQNRKRVYAGLQHFAATGHGDARKLQDHQDEWRLRVGDIRIRFTYPDPETLRVLRILPRDRAYR